MSIWALPAYASGQSEAYYTTHYCASIGGYEERRVNYKHSYVRIDCETDTHVIEAGLDKRGSLDSVQQAVFFSVLTNKIPVVVIYDRDGKEGKYEYRIRKVCERLGVEYRSVSVSNNNSDR